MAGAFNKIYRTVKKIPKGRVASYGQIAAMAGYPRGAQVVGWALHQMDSLGGQTRSEEHTSELQSPLHLLFPLPL